MRELQRFTTEYVDLEDRIRLSGETGPGETEVLWLTRRLLGRLVPHLCGWLERQCAVTTELQGSGVSDVLQAFALQAALQSLTPQAPVLPDKAHRNWVVQAVDVTTGEDALRLVLRGGEREQVRLSLPPEALRQWLGILHTQSCAGDWSLDAWPSWLSGVAEDDRQGAAILH